MGKRLVAGGMLGLLLSGCSPEQDANVVQGHGRNEAVQQGGQQKYPGSLLEKYSIPFLSEVDLSGLPDPLYLEGQKERQGYLDELVRRYAHAADQAVGREMGEFIRDLRVLYDLLGEEYSALQKEVVGLDREIYEKYPHPSLLLGPVYIRGAKIPFGDAQEKAAADEEGVSIQGYYMAVPFGGRVLGSGRDFPVFAFPLLFEVAGDERKGGARIPEERNLLIASYLGHEIYHVLFNKEGLRAGREKITVGNSMEILGLTERDFIDVMREVSEYNATSYQIRSLEGVPQLSRICSAQRGESERKLKHTPDLFRKITPFLLK